MAPNEHDGGPYSAYSRSAAGRGPAGKTARRSTVSSVGNGSGVKLGEKKIHTVGIHVLERAYGNPAGIVAFPMCQTCLAFRID
jgi:hypothetical protein